MARGELDGLEERRLDAASALADTLSRWSMHPMTIWRDAQDMKKETGELLARLVEGYTAMHGDRHAKPVADRDQASGYKLQISI